MGGRGQAAASSAAITAYSRAWKLEGLTTLEVHKARLMLENMEQAGYSASKAESVVTAVLGDQSEAHIRHAFDCFDESQDGFLDVSEVAKALPLMGEDARPEVVRKLIAKCQGSKWQNQL